jgi:glutamine synthetase
MPPRNPPSDPDGFLDWCGTAGVHTVVVGGADTQGAWVGKRVPVAELRHVLAGGGVAFSDVVFVLTRDGLDAVEPPAGCTTYFPRKEQGYPDIVLLPELDTARLLGWHDGTAALNGTFALPDGTPVPIAPRNVLRALTERAAARGLTARFGVEFEFYLLCGTPDELAAGGLTPLSPRPYTYSVYRSGVDNVLLSGFRGALESAGIEVEALNPETGPGQYEINTRCAETMRAADDAFLFKNALKELAAQAGLSATFMAKPRTDWAGSSCHLHQSLWSVDGGRPLLPAAAGHLELTELGRHYLGGLLATMAELTALFAPTVNSYRRFVPYSWAATTATWGYDNRSTGLRVVGEAPGSRRIEHRLGGADVNPYLAMAACLAGGLHGVENRIEPPPPTAGDAYADDSLPRLPADLPEALDLFAGSAVAREAFGADFVEHYVAMRRAELRQFATHVSDWEVRQYVETA